MVASEKPLLTFRRVTGQMSTQDTCVSTLTDSENTPSMSGSCVQEVSGSPSTQTNSTLTAQRQGISHEETQQAPAPSKRVFLLDAGVSHGSDSGQADGLASKKSKRIPGQTVYATGDEACYIRSACGCVHVPGALTGLLSRNRPILCPVHGWQKEWRKAAYREVISEVLQIPLDLSPLPDIPPF